MGKPHPIELRERVVVYVEEGHTHRASASRFRVFTRPQSNRNGLLKTENPAAKTRGKNFR
jgi:hypothetical protein